MAGTLSPVASSRSRIDRHPLPDQTIPDQSRASTGIHGLDHILGGGLPANHLPLLSDVDRVGAS